MDLSAFIRELGIEESADLFGVSTHTAKSWMYRERRPRPRKASEIVEVTKRHPTGKVSFADIYGEESTK